jgi:hypothetical protein
MAVYEGTLEQVSGGEVVSSEGTGGYFTHRMGVTRFRRTGVDRQAGWIRRQFVDIGGTRIKNVMVTPLVDELLKEAVGQEVALSMIGPPADHDGRHTVVAIRTPKGGLQRPSRKLILVGSIVLVFNHWLTAPFLALILLVPAWLASLLYFPLWWVGLAGAVLAGIWWMILPFVYAARTFRAADALSRLRPPLTEYRVIG